MGKALVRLRGGFRVAGGGVVGTHGRTVMRGRGACECGCGVDTARGLRRAGRGGGGGGVFENDLGSLSGTEAEGDRRAGLQKGKDTEKGKSRGKKGKGTYK